jgi:hypothetical protein
MRATPSAVCAGRADEASTMERFDTSLQQNCETEVFKCLCSFEWQVLDLAVVLIFTVSRLLLRCCIAA